MRQTTAIRRRRVLWLVTAMWMLLPSAAWAQSARERYQSALERDAEVRAAIQKADTPSIDLLDRADEVMTSFEAVVRRYPKSGYSDNALWQSASLADAAYRKFERAEDLTRAQNYYTWLVHEYPSSSLVKRANTQLASLSQSKQVVAVAEATPAGLATLTSIERTLLPDTVRVTLELDREVSYREERLAGPSRLFFDLKDVQTTAALTDTVLSYPGGALSKIRTGRHPGDVVRVVLDLEDVSRYSVFTLYNPFRLVVDAERAVSRDGTAPAAAVAVGPLATGATVPVPRMTPPAPAPGPALSSPTAPDTNGAGRFSIARQLGLGVSRIVIDPGHGGHDPGVLGRGLTESALVLDIALRLEKLLLTEPGVEVVLTRRTDVYIPLEARTEIANGQNADLFLSIHANSGRNPAAKGIETYFLSFASSPEAETVAARENSSSQREMRHLPDIIKAIALNNKLDESRDLAAMVQESLVTTLRKTNAQVRSRGVKKAPFVVLIGAEMPSVLAEISFVSNKQELALLKTTAYKNKIAESLRTALLRYRGALKATAAVAMQER